MTLRLNGSTSGYVEIDAPATAGSNTLTLPNGNGSNGQYLQTNGSGALSWATVSTSNLTRGTAVSTTSGTAFNFHNIPSTARRIVLLFDQVSVGSTDEMRIQLGTGTSGSPTWVTTNYVSSVGYVFYNATANSEGSTTTSNGWRFSTGNSNFTSSGRVVLENLTGNTWTESGVLAVGSTTNFAVYMSGGVKDAGATVTQIRLTTDSGTTAFDNGQVNIIYEVA